MEFLSEHLGVIFFSLAICLSFFFTLRTKLKKKGSCGSCGTCACNPEEGLKPLAMAQREKKECCKDKAKA